MEKVRLIMSILILMSIASLIFGLNSRVVSIVLPL